MSSLTTEQYLQIANMFITALGIPVAAIIGSFLTYKYTEKLNAKNRDHDLKLRIFAELMANRHSPVNAEGIRALNLIDVVFKDSFAVKEDWSRYYAYLSDERLNNDAGYAIRDEAKQELLTSMAKCIEVKNLSNVDLRRIYSPAVFAEEQAIANYERQYKMNQVKAALNSKPILEPEVSESKAEKKTAPILKTEEKAE